eukprot:IDg17920t1
MPFENCAGRGVVPGEYEHRVHEALQVTKYLAVAPVAATATSKKAVLSQKSNSSLVVWCFSLDMRAVFLQLNCLAHFETAELRVIRC